jgi:hypothetical protein
MATDNQFEFIILENGLVRVTSGKFSGPVHMAADAFILWAQRELGGDVKVAHSHGHTHAHEHEHTKK